MQKPNLQDVSDEIDLIKVLASVFKFLSRKRKSFLIFNLLGIAGGFIFYLVTDKIYSSRFTGECMLLPDGRTIELIKDLDGLRKNEDWATLGRRLGMRPEKVKEIVEIIPLPNATIDKESRGTEDYASQYNPMPFSFSVIAKVTDNSILPEFQKGMIRYLANNPYNSIRVSRFIESRKSLLQSVNKEIARLDSMYLLNKVIRFKSASGNEKNSEVPFKDILYELQEKKEAIEDELKFALPVRVIQDFTTFKKPIYPIKSITLAVSLLVANLLCIIFLTGKSVFQTISKPD